VDDDAGIFVGQLLGRLVLQQAERQVLRLRYMCLVPLGWLAHIQHSYVFAGLQGVWTVCTYVCSVTSRASDTTSR
jgi:hypothetical protein